MTDTVIDVCNLGKQYNLGLVHEDLFVNNVIRSAKAFFKRTQSAQPFWALKDISFSVEHGEIIGIIGKNGAGKSTLLKILSRITLPSEGHFQLRGRLASLLEVGTGFHPELTGRENVYLNGTILGMSRQEVKSKFDEIVAFSGVEKFIDTPVKRYSSGMHVRLAFSVAAHLDPDILLIDEVLAVGDYEFQRKCLGKMEEVGKGGRTILFVSHNISTISSLCPKCMLLSKGRIVKIGKTSEVIDLYYQRGEAADGEVDYERDKIERGDDEAKLLSARLVNLNGDVTTDFKIDESIRVEMTYRLLTDNLNISLWFHFYTSQGDCAFVASDGPLDPEGALKNTAGTYLSVCHIPKNFMNDGTYFIGLAVSKTGTLTTHVLERDLLMLRIVDPIVNTATRAKYTGFLPGGVRPALQWESKKLS